MLKSVMSQNFHMKNLGDIKYFMGLEIHRSQAEFFVSQKKYVTYLIKEYHIGDKVSKLPMETRLKLTLDT